MEIKLVKLKSKELKTGVRREVLWLGVSDDVLPGVELKDRINYITRTIFD